eukprot:gene42107-66311_t
MALTILCVTFTLLLLLGVPVAFSIGLSSLATILYEGLPLAVGFQQMISGMNPFSFLAIPFFIFAGEIMMYGGIADRIVVFAKSVAGHVRGGLGMSNVLACTLFGGVSGSPVADVSAIEDYMNALRKSGDSCGARIRVTAQGMPVGLGQPLYDRLDADIAYAMLGLNAVKGVEIGAGFSSVSDKGSTHGDSLTPEGFAANKAGGVLGGISTGQDLEVSIAIKPTSSILIP